MAQLAAFEAAVVVDEILSLRGCQLREVSPVIVVVVVVAAPLVLVTVGARAPVVVTLVLVPLVVVILSVDLLGDSVDKDLGKGEVIDFHRVRVGLGEGWGGGNFMGGMRGSGRSGIGRGLRFEIVNVIEAFGGGEKGLKIRVSRVGNLKPLQHLMEFSWGTFVKASFDGLIQECACII